MKSFTIFFTLILASQLTFAQTIWTGPDVSFTKTDLGSEVDMITDDIGITRGTRRGIYNDVSEVEYTVNVSPAGTEWAFGTTTDIANLSFDSWQLTHGGNPPGTVGRDMVLHLIADDIYIDIQFTSWAQRAVGFSYTRSSEPLTSLSELSALENGVTIEWLPNSRLKIKNASNTDELRVLDLSGKILKTARINGPNHTLDLAGLNSAIYILQVVSENGISNQRIAIN